MFIDCGKLHSMLSTFVYTTSAEKCLDVVSSLLASHVASLACGGAAARCRESLADRQQSWEKPLSLRMAKPADEPVAIAFHKKASLEVPLSSWTNL